MTANELDAPPGLLGSSGRIVWMTGPGGPIRIVATRHPTSFEQLDLGAVPNHVAAFEGGVWGSLPHDRQLVKICW